MHERKSKQKDSTVESKTQLSTPRSVHPPGTSIYACGTSPAHSQTPSSFMAPFFPTLNFILKVKSSLPWPFTVRCHLLLQAPSPPPGPPQPWTSVSLQSNQAMPGSCLCTLQTPEPSPGSFPDRQPLSTSRSSWATSHSCLQVPVTEKQLLFPSSWPAYHHSLLQMLFPLQSWKFCLSSRGRKQRNKPFFKIRMSVTFNICLRKVPWN